MQQRSRLLAFSKLLRLSIAFTPLADVVTGYALCINPDTASGFLDPRLCFACAASVAAFCFGTSLNDYLNRHKDKRLAPARPLPSGEISSGSALALCSIMGFLAICLAFMAGMRTGFMVAAVLLLAVSYNLWSRRNDYFGVFNLGCIRATDLLVGVTVAYPDITPQSWWSFPDNGLPLGIVVVLYGCHGISLSIVALAERAQRSFDFRIPAAVAVLLALVPVASAFAYYPLVAVAVWLILAIPVLRLFRKTENPDAASLVGHFVSGFFLLGALYILGRGHLWICILLLTLYFVSRALGRYFPPT